LFHSFGQTCCLNTGIRAGVPAMYQALLHYPDRARYDVSSLRLSETSPVASF